MGNTAPRFAFVSHLLPPSWSGQAVAIGRLVGGLAADSYRLVSLNGEWQIPRGHRFGVQVPNAAIGIASRARRMAKIVRQAGCEVIVAASGDAYDLPAAALAGRRAGVPVVAYYFDDYAHQAWHPVTRWVGRRLEPRFLRRAAGVIVPNEAMGEELRRRYGVDSVVVRNPCDVDRYDAKPRPRHDPPRIVFTGAVAESNVDALGNLLAAIEGTPYELHVYSAQPPETLRGRVVFHPHLDPAEMPRVQSEADVLFLPLGLRSRYPDLIRTSAPAKLGEYLAAGRPLLAHVPDDSFVASFLRRHDCGLVVSDPRKLREAIEQLASEDEARGARAREVARAEFSTETSRRRFLDVLRAAVGR